MVQQAYSRTYNVNFMAANTGATPRQQGSGMYSNGEVLAYHYSPTEKNDDAMLVADMPIQPTLASHRRAAGHVLTWTKPGNNGAGATDAAAVQEQQLVSTRAEEEEQAARALLPSVRMETFKASAGKNFTLSVGLHDGLLCKAHGVVGAQANDEQFALVALNGNILSAGNITACALVRCPIKDLCVLDVYERESATVFESFRVEAHNLAASATNFQAVGCNGQQLPENGSFGAARDAVWSPNNGASVKTPLLAAAVFSKTMHDNA